MAKISPKRMRELVHKMHELLEEIGSPQACRDIFVTAMHHIEVNRPLPDIESDD